MGLGSRTPGCAGTARAGALVDELVAFAKMMTSKQGREGVEHEQENYRARRCWRLGCMPGFGGMWPGGLEQLRSVVRCFEPRCEHVGNCESHSKLGGGIAERCCLHLRCGGFQRSGF